MSQIDVILELSKLTARALRALGNAGAAERQQACEWASEAWSLLHEEHPAAAERMNGVLHYLTGPRFAEEDGADKGSSDTKEGDAAEHPWLPAPMPLTSEEDIHAYFEQIRNKADGDDDFDMEVRHLIPAFRHSLIFDAFKRLRPGQGFFLINDHDPKPLYYQFAVEYADRFTWDPVEEGPDVWRVRIGRR